MALARILPCKRSRALRRSRQLSCTPARRSESGATLLPSESVTRTPHWRTFRPPVAVVHGATPLRCFNCARSNREATWFADRGRRQPYGHRATYGPGGSPTAGPTVLGPGPRSAGGLQREGAPHVGDPLSAPCAVVFWERRASCILACVARAVADRQELGRKSPTASAASRQTATVGRGAKKQS